jgi:hypothetical protein
MISAKMFFLFSSHEALSFQPLWQLTDLVRSDGAGRISRHPSQSVPKIQLQALVLACGTKRLGGPASNSLKLLP